MMEEILVKLGRIARNWAANTNPWTNVYGVARTMLALATALTMMFNHSSVLLFPMRECQWPANIGLFCLMSNHLELARWIAVTMLLVTASGWRPRVTGLFHWWLSLSLRAAIPINDGGDVIASVLTLLLLPVCLTDNRKWHWQPPAETPAASLWPRLLALSALVMVRLQVSGIYFHASVSKLYVDEWSDGTAAYYWFTHPFIGAPSWELRLLSPLMSNGPFVTLLTWGAIVIELLLFMSLVMPKRFWPYMLGMGIFFHVAIVVFHGIPTFSAVVIAALLLYLHPVEQPFALPFISPKKYQPDHSVVQIEQLELEEAVRHQGA